VPAVRPLPPARADAFGVYVHVPFCRRRCDYCAFATWVDRHHLWDRYAAACRAEAGRLQGVETVPPTTVPTKTTVPTTAAPTKTTSVFFGGGTPSLWPAELLVGVLDAIRECVPLVAGSEVTVECNPETVTAGKLASYRAAGVTRLSFGAQSMVPHVLAALGREHDPASVRRAAELAGEAGFAGAYSVDLIFGAAGESVADWEASLDAVLAFDPPPAHLSAYALTIEPGTPLASQPERHPSDDDQADKYLLAEAKLAAHGFEWYEISNWARPGARCAHNLLYWSQGEYAGLGCAAHSHRVQPDGTARRWWNVRTPERYCSLIEAGDQVEAAGESLGADEREWEAMVLSLRTSAGVPADVVPQELFDHGLMALRPAAQAGASAGAGLGAEAGASASAGAGDGARAGAGPTVEAGAGGARAVLTPQGRLLANEVAVRLAPAGRPGRR
jgi:putative oxygen-independent coproporphyrinogen III oxidase